MNIAIIDADLIGRAKHRFPNLASMKISAYHKNNGDTVFLKTDYDNSDQYDRVYISKVFMDTEIPYEPDDKTLKTEDTIALFYKDNLLLNQTNVEYGGTGFYYDKAHPLSNNIEHIFPDYHLYDDWVKEQINKGSKSKDFDYFYNHSIGYTTRGCIRKCNFCVNKNCTKSIKHSPVSEFLDSTRKYICLLDDNVFACKDWKQVFTELQDTNKPFQFKQGLDERLLTDEKCDMLFNKSKWIGDYIFAFDNIKDAPLIEDKLKLIRKYTNKIPKFYTFCAYNHNNPEHYDEEFWAKDIFDLFKRIEILMKYNCLPYIMRYKDYELSPYKGMYINFARWCNQPNFFKKTNLVEYAQLNQERTKNGICSAVRYIDDFAKRYPEIANKYYYIKWNDKVRKAKVS